MNLQTELSSALSSGIDQPIHELWPHADWSRKQDAETIRAKISRRVGGDLGAINNAAIALIRGQRVPGTLRTDPDGAAEVRKLLATHDLTAEVEKLIADADREHEQHIASEHPLYCKPSARVTGKDAIAEFAGDREPISGGKDRWDANSLKNVAIFLVMNGITLWHNDFDHKDYLDFENGAGKRLTDEVILDLKMRMHSIGLRVTTEFCHDALKWFAQKNAKHPVRDYLDKCEWDGRPRLDAMLHRYFGAEDNDYHRFVGSKLMMAAVRRVRQPGTKFDIMLVLEGPQGAMKSTALRTLASSPWFTDGMAVGSNAKETIELTCGKWIVETAELAGLSKRDVNEVKQALSKQSDNARQSYDRLASDVQRQFVFCGTTNNAQYLRDRTGNRRFWCVTVGKIAIEELERDRNQLWAEAAYREAQDERIYLKDAEYDLAVAEQAKREEDDELEIALDDLIDHFDEGQVTKLDLYAALGHEGVAVARASGSVGAKVLSGMARRGWKSTRETIEKRRQWCFTKGTLPPLLVYDKDNKQFRAIKGKDKRSLH